jgi:hypothetical protein
MDFETHHGLTILIPVLDVKGMKGRGSGTRVYFGLDAVNPQFWQGQPLPPTDDGLFSG